MTTVYVEADTKEDAVIFQTRVSTEAWLLYADADRSDAAIMLNASRKVCDGLTGGCPCCRRDRAIIGFDVLNERQYIKHID
jgi:hypothetical protein